MSVRILPAIMSGGAGARLWPLSTEAAPKQFHTFGGGASLFAETVLRVRGDVDGPSFAPPIIFCNAAHAARVEEELAQIGADATAIVLEPVARNTAPLGALAAALGGELAPDALVLLLPADHHIDDTPAFHAAIGRATPYARERIVTFGVTPTRPSTGYGYIARGEEIGDGVFAIAAFTEKPDAATARAYIDAGGYSWNAGMFLFSPRVMLEEFAGSAAIRDGALEALRGARRVGARIELDEAAFAAIPDAPLDIAVMEKTTRGAVAPCAFGWADIGSWDEIWRLAPKDGDGNATHGSVVTLDAANNLVRAEGVTVCAAGVENLVIVATPDGVIVLPRERAQDVKLLLERARDLPRD